MPVTDFSDVDFSKQIEFLQKRHQQKILMSQSSLKWFWSQTY